MFLDTHKEMCNVCLSADRRLTLLGNYHEIFVRVCNKEPWYQNGDPMLCWECLGLLQKVQKFQEKAFKAQSYLETNIKSEDNPNLSTLVVEKAFYDYVINRGGDTNQQCNVKLEAPEFEVEVPEFSVEVPEIEVEVPEFNATNIKTEQYDDFDFGCDKLEDEPAIKKESECDNIESSRKRKSDHPEPEIKSKIKKKSDKSEKEVVKKGKSKEKSKKLKKNINPYKVINVAGGGGRGKKWYRKIKIDEEEMQMWLQKRRDALKNANVKCDKCVTGYLNSKSYLQHMEGYHHESAGAIKCPVCDRGFHSKDKMSRHSKLHYFKYVCLKCKEENHRTQDHNCSMMPSQKLYECLKCGQRYDLRKSFFIHYQQHTMFICDHCGKVTSTKNALSSHMRNTHIPIKCKICQITFKKYIFLARHNRVQHTYKATEDSYCVECDVQYDNIDLYKRHLTRSVKHNVKPNKKYPCKECGKIFNKSSAAKYHYNYYHLKQTKFFCEPCDRFFLNGFRLRRHTERFHKKIPPPKNKFCSYCNRGFSNRNILANHVRTHTGERPFKCEHCPAAFTQQQALKAHERAKHKDRIK